MLENVVEFKLPKHKPRIVQKDAPPDQRKFCVIPFRAVADKNLTDGGIRVLAALCSYCNKAGITWVSQQKLAEDLKVSRQGITNQLAQLRSLGYVEIMSKAIRGIKPSTIRVIFDPSIDADTAIAITSTDEDTRPPEMKRKQDEAMHEVDQDGLKRIASLVSKSTKTITQQPKERTMSKPGESPTVVKMKQEIAKAQAKKATRKTTKPADNHASEGTKDAQEIGNLGFTQRHPTVSSRDIEECPRTHQGTIDTIGFNKVTIVLGNEIKKLKEEKLSTEQIVEDFELLMGLYAAEGITPTPGALADAILQLHRDTKQSRGLL